MGDEWRRYMYVEHLIHVRHHQERKVAEKVEDDEVSVPSAYTRQHTGKCTGD